MYYFAQLSTNLYIVRHLDESPTDAQQAGAQQGPDPTDGVVAERQAWVYAHFRAFPWIRERQPLWSALRKRI
jgi:hypothetical protein